MTPRHIARTLVAALASLLLTVLPRLAVGQLAPPIGPGARVRVSHTDRCCASPQVGSLVSVSSESVVVRAGRDPQTTVVALPRRAVRSFALGYEGGRYTQRGATLGAVTGILVGVGYALTLDCQGDEICESFRPLAGGVGAVICGAGGLLLGGLMGHSIVRQEWVPVPLPERVGLAPAPGGGLTVRLALRL